MIHDNSSSNINFSICVGFFYVLRVSGMVDFMVHCAMFLVKYAEGRFFVGIDKKTFMH